MTSAEQPVTSAEASPRSAPRRTRALVLLGVCLALVAAAGAVEARTDPTAVDPLGPVAAEPPSSGWWYCPATAGEDESAVLAVAAAGDEPTTVTVVRFPGGGRVVEDAVEVPPGAQHLRGLGPGEANHPVAVRWRGGPAVATWRVRGDDDAAAPCESTPSPRWHLTGFDTTAQNQGLLHLFNPFGVDAVVRVTFGTPTGAVALVLTDNVLVPAEGTVRLSLGDFEPQQPDLAVTVEALAGRVVAQGETRLRPTANQPGPTGRALLPAVRAPAAQWSFAYAASGEPADSWLSVYNPGEREAAVQISVSDPLPDGAALLSEVSVPAGGVVRVELEDTSGAPEYGVDVRTVTELPVVASRLSTVRTDAAEGVAATTGVAPATDWALAGAAAAERDAELALYNPGADPVTVALDAGQGTPAGWAAIELSPNGRVAVDLADAGAERRSVPLQASGDGPFVAELRSRAGGDALRLWSAVAVPRDAWRGPQTRPPVWRDPTLSTSPVVPEPTAEPEAAEPDA